MPFFCTALFAGRFLHTFFRVFCMAFFFLHGLFLHGISCSKCHQKPIPCSLLQERRPEAEGRAGSWRPGNPYCSPVLVRKKAIRSKVLRSGAYRDCGAESQPHQPPREAGECLEVMLKLMGLGGRGLGFGGEEETDQLLQRPQDGRAKGHGAWHCSPRMKASWPRACGPLPASPGECTAASGPLPPLAVPTRLLVPPRDGGIALLRRDVPGAFLLRPEPGLAKRWCLWVRAPCGVVPYCVFRTPQGRFCVEVRALHRAGGDRVSGLGALLCSCSRVGVLRCISVSRSGCISAWVHCMLVHSAECICAWVPWCIPAWCIGALVCGCTCTSVRWGMGLLLH